MSKVTQSKTEPTPRMRRRRQRPVRPGFLYPLAEKGSILETSGGRHFVSVPTGSSISALRNRKMKRIRRVVQAPSKDFLLTIEQKSESAINQSDQHMPQLLNRENMGCQRGCEITLETITCAPKVSATAYLGQRSIFVRRAAATAKILQLVRC